MTADGDTPVPRASLSGPESHESGYFAVLFTTLRPVDGSDDGYAAMAERMDELARHQPGYLGMDSARGVDGVGITVSYWESLEAIAAWRDVEEHRKAQIEGRRRWYDGYTLRVARVERGGRFDRPDRTWKQSARSVWLNLNGTVFE